MKKSTIIAGQVAFHISLCATRSSLLLSWWRSFRDKNLILDFKFVFNELYWWYKFWCITMCFLKSDDECIESDSCLIGSGGISSADQQYFHAMFPGHIECLNLHINTMFLILLTAVVCVKS